MRRIILSVVCLVWAVNVIVARRHAKDPEIPILAWLSIIPGQFQTEDHYREMRDCGFTLSFVGGGCDYETAMKSLDLCRKVGMKSMFCCPELKSDPEKTVAKVKNHPALAGYYLRDEPRDSDFEALAVWSERVRKADPKHTRYLNLLPTYGFGDIESYRQHLRHFTDLISLPQLSYDHYPLVQSGDTVMLRPTFYENLELISAEARRLGIPFWAFALSSGHACYPVPRLGHLRLQLYADLAYGAQCLQYFTYWTHYDPNYDDHHLGPMSRDGHRQGTYELLREMNQELQRRARVFVGCQVESVYHMGNEIPEGTTRLPSLPPHFLQLDTHGRGALISTLTNKGTRYYVIQNTSANHVLKLDLQTDDTLLLVRRDGTAQPADLYGPYFELEVGDVLIFQDK